MEEGLGRFSYDNESFLKRFDGSHPHVQRVARMLREAGIDVDVPSPRIRGALAEAEEFSKKEMDILLPASNEIIEVKSRNIAWRDLADYPFDDMIVDTVSGFDKKARKPLAYVIVSALDLRGTPLIAFSAGRSKWTKEQRYDKVRGLRDWYYHAAKKNITTFDELVKRCRSIEPQAD